MYGVKSMQYTYYIHIIRSWAVIWTLRAIEQYCAKRYRYFEIKHIYTSISVVNVNCCFDIFPLFETKCEYHVE